MRILTLVILLIAGLTVSAQNIYKTPTGTKYHLSSCRMVENVSNKLVNQADWSKLKLEPCKICKPPLQHNIFRGNSQSNKAVGQASSVRCQGKTQKKTRCKHMTRLANGYCYQHTAQNSSLKSNSLQSTQISTCGARTKSGSYCKRKVKGGGRCHQHN